MLKTICHRFSTVIFIIVMLNNLFIAGLDDKLNHSLWLGYIIYGAYGLSTLQQLFWLTIKGLNRPFSERIDWIVDNLIIFKENNMMFSYYFAIVSYLLLAFATPFEHLITTPMKDWYFVQIIEYFIQ